jgi:hypothetical protein
MDTGWGCDSEPVFKSIRKKSILGDVRGGLHNKRAGRFIRKVKEKRNAIRAGLSYDLPRKLQFELFAFTVDTTNMVPNTQTGNYTTPFQLMTRKRPVIGSYKFGQVGYMYMKRPELNDVRAEFGIYCGYDLNNLNSMRIYSVWRDTLYMRNKFVPQPYVPNEHNLKQRVETTLPSDEMVDIISICDEVQQIIDVGAIAPAPFESLSERERTKVIPSHLFVTPKCDAQGNFVEKGDMKVYVCAHVDDLLIV